MAHRWGFTVFVDNLPCNLDRFGLKGIFQRVGNVSDSFIPTKLSQSRKRFGFVRFRNKIDAVNSIRRLNGTTIRGSKIRVYRARFGKETPKQDMQMKQRKLWREKRVQAHKLNQTKQEVVATVKGESNDIFLEWLNRSLICVSKELWDLEDLSQALVKVGCSKICALSKFKFILTFLSSEQMEEALNHGNLANWFHEVKHWDIYEVCETRRSWIEVFGVPPHGWTLRNFESIAAIWGKMVCLGTPIDETISFESMRILVEGNGFQEFKGHIILQIGDAGYRIMVKEADCSININPQFIAPETSSSTGVKIACKGSSEPAIHEQSPDASRNLNLNLNSIEIHKFGQSRDSLIENINSGAAMEREHKLCEDRLEGDKSAEVQRGFPLNADDVEVCSGQPERKLIRSAPISHASSTKTKSAQLSGNGYSEEIEKIYCHGITYQDEVNHHSRRTNGKSSPPASELSAPPGFGHGKVSESPEVRPNQKAKNSKQGTGYTERRVTRSQAKQCKKPENRNPEENDSANTPPGFSTQCVGVREGSPL